MSTRAVIEFCEKQGKSVECPGVKIYRHSDGYPSAIIPELYEVMRVLRQTRSERGAGYIAADVIFLWKMKYMLWYNNTFPRDDPDEFLEWVETQDQPAFLLGFGVVPAIYDDCGQAYTYKVILPMASIMPSDTDDSWEIEIYDSDGELIYYGKITDALDAEVAQLS